MDFRAGIIALLALAGTLWVRPAIALDTDRSLGQFHHMAWTRAQGAPSQISALAQTRDGFLWMGSTQGLYRFDGITFTRFEPPGGTELPSHNIYALHATRDGGLWVSFRPSGLGYIRDGRITVYTRPGVIPATQVYSFATAGDGRLFAGTHTGIAQWDGARWQPLDASWGVTPGRVRQLVVLPRGLAAVVGREVLLLPPRATRFVKLADVPGEPIEAVSDGAGALWVACNGGLLHVPAEGPSRFETASGDPPYLEILFDHDGALWLGNDFGLLRIRDPARTDLGDAMMHPVDTYTHADGLSGDNIIHIFEDRERNVWVATSRGLDRFRSNPVVPVAMPDGYESATIAEGEAGSVWVAPMFKAPMIRVDAAHRRGERVPFVQASRPMQARSVMRAPDGTLWWGGLGAVYRQRGTTLEEFQAPPPASNELFWDIARAPDGDGLWVGAGDLGVWRMRDDTMAPATVPAGMLTRVPSASYDDGAGTQWFGYTENRIRVIDRDGRVTAYGPRDGLDIGRAKVIRGNAVQRWVGGELGVAFFDGSRFHRVRFAGPVQPGAVGGIVSTRGGDVWLSEMRGLIRIPVDEMRALLRNPRHVVRAEWFDEGDGLPGAPQMNTTNSTALETRDGVLWFMTDAGLAWVDPAKVASPGPPPAVRLLTVRGTGEAVAPGGGTRFAQGTDHLEFAWTAMTLTEPERVRFRYRLEGFEDGWQDAGTRREATYSRVPPGDYVFRVIAALPGQPWTGAESATRISIAPAFWQTPWFLALCVLGALLLVIALYLLRVHQMERQMLARLQERHGERERIARELHDTLLQGIHGLILRFHAIATRMPADDAIRNAMETALDRADDMLVESRDRVTNLRTSVEPVTTLPVALTRAGQQLGEGFPGQFVHAVQGVERTIDPIVQDDIYQLGREALFNAFNHSGGSRIELLMVFDHHRFVLRVLDNGRGVDPALATGGAVPGHWGLAGMRERAERVSGALSIGAGVDGGTAIELVVPARTAYAVSAAKRFHDWAFRRATMHARD